jgi:hypothetical protein
MIDISNRKFNFNQAIFVDYMYIPRQSGWQISGKADDDSTGIRMAIPKLSGW